MFNKIKNEFYGNIDKIRELLENIGCLKIRLIKDNFKFALDDEGSFSGNGNSLNVNTLKYVSYSHNYKGDIISLVSYKLNIKLGDSLKYLCKFLNIDWDYTSNSKIITLPFNGFYLNYEKVQEENYNYKTYDDKIVQEYEKNGLSLYWIKDEISAITQERFRIGYDPFTERITVPWYDEFNRCIGIQGRLDRSEVADWESKYLPIIPFAKSNTLYGLHANYKAIQELGVVIITESEKSCLKAYEMGYTNVLSVGSHSLSKKQIKLIKSLAVNVILAYDEDVPLEESMAQAKELIISNPFFSNEVYILDMSGLEKKSCIFDLGKEVVDKALEERLIYLG